MLNGVGGCTVAEAKERLSVAEVVGWAGYMQRRGSLHVGLRVEAGFALLAWIINHALGGTATMDTYMPHIDSTPDIVPADASDEARLIVREIMGR